jgi:hypothetical protein
MVNNLLRTTFTAEYMATHTMTGSKPSRGEGETKGAMDQVIRNKIIGKLKVVAAWRAIV